MRLEGKTAIVTGGGKGIGEAIAVGLSAAGCKVAVAGRTLSSLETTAAKIRSRERDALAIVCDVADPLSIEKLFAQVDAAWGVLDILVNNAGQSQSEPLHKVSLETWRRMLDVNLTGAFLCSQAALKRMLPRKAGRIINIASTAAKIGFRYAGAYTAAKHGVLGLTRSMALEVATSGITVNAVCPGWVESDMLHLAIKNIMEKTKMTEQQVREVLANESPQKRVMQPEEIANVTVFLALDESRGVNGQAIDVCGGQVMS